MGSQRCPVPAIRFSRVEFRLEAPIRWDCPGQVVLKAGSCAADGYESRQVRKEAAVNSIFWVPQEHLAGAGWPG